MSAIPESSSAPSDLEKKNEDNKQKQSNLQRIQLRKQSVRAWPAEKKIEKLAPIGSIHASGRVARRVGTNTDLRGRTCT